MKYKKYKIQNKTNIKERNMRNMRNTKYKIQGVFLRWASPKKLKYGKPRLGESTLT